jgi:UDP-glucose 4-epimerase
MGRHLCRALVARGAAVRALSLGVPVLDDIFGGLAHTVEWIDGELADAALVRGALRDVDVVYHLVSTTIPASSNADLPGDLVSNVLPTLGLLESLRATRVRTLIFVSSGGTVYGVPHGSPVTEEHDTSPICGYGIHKLAIEKYLHLYSHQFGLDYRVLRVSNPYGIGQVSERAQGVIGRFLHRALRGEPLEIWGDGSVVRDYVAVEDVIEAFLTAAIAGGNSRIFNIGSGVGHSLRDIVGVIEGVAGRTVEVSYRPARSVDVPLNVLDIGRARRELGWEPRVDLATGIRRLFEHYSAAGGERDDA